MSKSDAMILDLMPVHQERLSASAFQKLVAENSSMIKSSKIIPPKLGGNDFGAFEVEYSRPIYRALESKPKNK